MKDDTTTTTKPLSVGDVKPKPKTRFQKLWDEAEHAKAQNIELEAALDNLVIRIISDIGPIEHELGVAMRAQIDKLIVFAGRKSLSQWQLYVLDDWITATLDFLHPLGMIDEALSDSLVQLQAKTLGIGIDADSEVPIADQLRSAIDEQFEEDDLSTDNPSLIDEDDFMQFFEETVAQLEKEEASEFDENTDDYSEQGDHTDYNDDWQHKGVELTNTVFKTLFHRVARALHPDKEVDPDKIAQKQALMSELLTARRQHDIMHIIHLYRTHVSDSVDFSEQDLMELEQVLCRYIDRERRRYFEIASKTYLHDLAFHEFYNRNPANAERSLAKRIKQMKKQKAQIESFTKSVTSLKKLKPHLESRYKQDSWWQ